MILEREIGKWRDFAKALRGEERAAFEELMIDCRSHASAAGAAARPIVSEGMFMSILLSHQKMLKQIEATLEKVRSSLHSD